MTYSIEQEMKDLFDVFLKFGSIKTEKALRILRGMMLLVFSVKLYIAWVGDFLITTDLNEILKYFMSEKFLYSVLIYCFVMLSETVMVLLVAKMNELLLIGKVLKAMEEIQSEISNISESKKIEIQIQGDEIFKKFLGGIFKWLGVKYEHEEFKGHFKKELKAIDPESSERYGLFSIEVFIYLVCTGHSWWWIVPLIIILIQFTFMKAFLIVLKTMLPIYLEKVKKLKIILPS